MSFVYPKYVWVPYEVCQDLSSAKIPQSGLESCVVGLPTPRWTGSGQNWVCLSQLDLNIDVVCLFSPSLTGSYHSLHLAVFLF